MCSGSLLLLFGSLLDEFHELVELRRDDNLGAAVALLAYLRSVGGNRVKLATAAGCQALGVNTVLVLQLLYDTGGTQTGEVPVVADVLTRDGHVVGVSFDEHIVVFVVLDDLGNLRERLCCAFVDFVRAALVEHVVCQGDVDDTFQHLYVNFLELFLGERTCEVVGEYHVQRVALALHFHQVADVLVRLVDLVDELVDADVVLAGVGQALV